MGIESGKPTGFEVYLSEVENLARQLRSGNETEQKMAREVLQGMRQNTLANLARLDEEETAHVTGGAIKKPLPGHTDRFTQDREKERASLRVINVALGLEENDQRAME